MQPRLAALVTSVALVVAACGDGDSTSVTAPDTTSSPSSSSPASTAAPSASSSPSSASAPSEVPANEPEPSAPAPSEPPGRRGRAASRRDGPGRHRRDAGQPGVAVAGRSPDPAVDVGTPLTDLQPGSPGCRAVRSRACRTGHGRRSGVSPGPKSSSPSTSSRSPCCGTPAGSLVGCHPRGRRARPRLTSPERVR